MIAILYFAHLTFYFKKMTHCLQLNSILRYIMTLLIILNISFFTPTASAAFVPESKQMIAGKVTNPKNLADDYTAIAKMSNKEIESLTGKKLTLWEKAGLFILRNSWKKTAKKRIAPPLTFDSTCFTMYLKNGEVLEVNLIQISTNEIKYKRCNKPEDPEIIVDKADVFSIKDSNGDAIYSSKDDKWTRRGSSANDRTDGLALAAGITGIGAVTLGLLFFPLGLAAGLAAGIMGIVSMRRFRNNPKLRGEGWAITGIVAGGLWLLLTALVLIAIASIW